MAITRFAPSPTGDLHVGSARCALYCWLWARHHVGKFILRIEDTDLERSTEAAIKVILDGMNWLGLDYDEGPIYQTKRFDRYKEVVAELLESGHAYKCYCSKERLEKLREEQQANKLKPKYDGYCLENAPQDASAPYVIRFKTPKEGSVVFRDLIKGKIEVANRELDDLIIARADGTPTYNLTVVVDDLDMQISHVLRGDDHINNTPRQIHIFRALGATPPEYAHMPMLLGPDGKKYSKRHGAASVLDFQQQGILQEALLNYLVRLGWSHGDKEIFTLDEMIELFDISGIHVSPARVDPEKLLWVNQHYIKSLAADDLAARLEPFLVALAGVDLGRGPSLALVVDALRERAKTLCEMAEAARYFYQDEIVFDDKAKNKALKADAKPFLEAILAKLDGISAWQADKLHAALQELITELDTKMGKIGQPLRVAITGGSSSPSLDITMELIGRERVLQRVKDAIRICG